MKKLLIIIMLLGTLVSVAQLPTKQKYPNEYEKRVIGEIALSDMVMNALYRRVPKYLDKLGFKNYKITKIGIVTIDRKWKQPISNRAAGRSALYMSHNVTEAYMGIDRMTMPESTPKIRFQVNIRDIYTGEVTKIRLNSFYVPRYIIKKVEKKKEPKKPNRFEWIMGTQK